MTAYNLLSNQEITSVWQQIFGHVVTVQPDGCIAYRLLACKGVWLATRKFVAVEGKSIIVTSFAAAMVNTGRATPLKM
jgi:hypothetical protein